MQYRPYGNLGIEVSALGFGAMRLPLLEDGTCDYDRGVPMLQRGIELGITYIDTADFYMDGTSEVAVGMAVKEVNRKALTIATKIRAYTEEDARGDTWRASFEASLRRLDMDYVDLILFANLHWAQFDDWVCRPGMALEAARKAQEEGLVRHIGFSSHDAPENIIRLIDTGEFAGMLVQYNYLYPHNEPAIARAGEKGLGVAVMGPLAEGRLANCQLLITEGDGTSGVKAPELALRFVWSNPHVSVALSGMNAMSHLEENATSVSWISALSEEQRAQVERMWKLASRYCTDCGDCMPCPNGVNIPENFRYANWFRVWGMEDDARKAYAKLGEEGNWQPWAGPIEGLKAEECAQCGQCEPKCPQNIAIIEQLEEVAATLG